MNERLTITVLAVLLSVATYVYFYRHLQSAVKSIGSATLLFTGALLYFYHYHVYDPAHGISILILPLATFWLAFRRERTGKPDISNVTFMLIQGAYCVLYVVMVYLQEG